MQRSIDGLMMFLPEIVGTRETFHVALSGRPSLEELRNLIEPHLDGQRMEHVAVLYQGKRCSMFVGDNSAATRIRNVEATAIYRNNWLTQHPGTDPESLPAVSGPAVLFDRNVWF